MRHRLPPLNALRAFEAAARHMSFSKAADELHVTPAAVSHQIKTLEEHVGMPLFRRLNRGLLLTEAGQLFLPGLRDGFDRLAEAVDRLRALEAGGELTVSMPPSFAAKWLVPRLERFTSLHPDIDVRISASMELVDFRRDRVDAAVRFGFGRWPDLEIEKLFAETAAPICSPRLLQGPHPLRTPADLRHHTLLHDDSIIFHSGPDWRMWLKAAGVEGVDPLRGPRFSHAEHALQAAADGAGVVLGRLTLAAADIVAGRLLLPFELSLPVRPAYFLVLPKASSRPRRVVAFRDWLLAEAARERGAAA